MERQGFPAFAGVGTYRCHFDARGHATRGHRWVLELPIVDCAARAFHNGRCLGARAWPPYRFEFMSELLRETANELVIAVANAAANRFYAGTRFQQGLQAAGLGAVPQLRCLS